MGNLSAIDFNLLRTLVAVVEERSTTAAARRLFVSQPTISGALARLRQIVGDELLVRNGRMLEPTSRALELVETLKPHLEAIDGALNASTPFDPASDARLFRLGCTDAAAFALLPELTPRLRQTAPKCSLSVRIGDFRVLPGMLALGEISTALAFLREDPPATTKVKVLHNSPWVVLRDRCQPTLAGLDDFAPVRTRWLRHLGIFQALSTRQWRARVGRAGSCSVYRAFRSCSRRCRVRTSSRLSRIS